MLPRKLMVASGSPNLAVNGGMGSDTGWTKPSGVTIADGVAKFVSVASNQVFYQVNDAIVVGDYYLLEVDISNLTAGAVHLYLNNELWSARILANGHYAYIVAAKVARIELRTIGTTSLHVDNISVRKLNPALFSLSSNLLRAFNVANWSPFGANTIEDAGGYMKVTYVDNQSGARGFFRASAILSSDLIIGKTYQVTGRSKKTGGTLCGLVAGFNYNTGVVLFSPDAWADFTYTFVCDHATNDYIRANTQNGATSAELDLYAVREVTQTEL